MAPQADNEIHGDQCDLEEDVEEQQVHRAEKADEPRFHHEIEREICAWLLLLLPGIEQRQEGEQGGQQDQR